MEIIFKEVIMFLVMILASQADDGPYPPTKICEPICNLIYTTREVCADWYGSAITLGCLCEELIQTQSRSQICDYYQPGTTMQTCFYKNGTIELNMCRSIWNMVNVLKPRCSDYFQVSDNVTALGKLQQRLFNPCKNCNPALGVQFCQLRSSPTGDPCLNCTD